jgi:hypothetical protein
VTVLTMLLRDDPSYKTVVHVVRGTESPMEIQLKLSAGDEHLKTFRIKEPSDAALVRLIEILQSMGDWVAEEGD